VTTPPKPALIKDSVHGLRGAPERLNAWLFTEMPLARVALLRVAVFGFVVIDVLNLHTSGYFR
jgi:hypothetical protein